MGKEPKGCDFGRTVQEKGLTHAQKERTQKHPIVAKVNEGVGKGAYRVESSSDEKAEPKATSVNDVVRREVSETECQEAQYD